MAYCENCNSPGHDPRELTVARRKGEESLLLVGPCCTGAPPPEPEVSYGLEVSSHYGLLAYLKMGGMKLEYRRTPTQLKELVYG